MTTSARLPARALRHGLTAEILEDRACSETIAAAFSVHEALGAWHEHATYKNALAVELHERGLRAHKDATLSVLYRQRVVGSFAADLLVEDRLLVLVRADPTLTADHKTDALRGLATGGVRVGLVFNFGVPELFFARVC